MSGYYKAAKRLWGQLASPSGYFNRSAPKRRPVYVNRVAHYGGGAAARADAIASGYGRKASKRYPIRGRKIFRKRRVAASRPRRAAKSVSKMRRYAKKIVAAANEPVTTGWQDTDQVAIPYPSANAPLTVAHGLTQFWFPPSMQVHDCGHYANTFDTGLILEDQKENVAAAGQNSDKDHFTVFNWQVKAMLRCTSNNQIHVTPYLCYPRQAVGEIAGVGSPISIMGNGFTGATAPSLGSATAFTGVPNIAAGNIVSAPAWATPYMSPNFCQMFRIKKLRGFDLGPSEQRQITLADFRERNIANDLVNSNYWSYPKWAKFMFFQITAGIAQDHANPARINTGLSSICLLAQSKITWTRIAESQRGVQVGVGTGVAPNVVAIGNLYGPDAEGPEAAVAD